MGQEGGKYAIEKAQVKKIVSVFLLIGAVVNFSLAEETAFRGVKLADAKGKQADASLIFSDNNKNVVVRVADRDFTTIPYDQIDKFSYEYTKKHPITQGAIVMVATLRAGSHRHADQVQEPLALGRFPRTERSQEHCSAHGKEGV